VEYDSIFADEEGTSNLREWFRIPPPGPAADVAAVAALAAAEGGFDVHEGLNFQLRPQPPAEVSHWTIAGGRGGSQVPMRAPEYTPPLHLSHTHTHTPKINGEWHSTTPADVAAVAALPAVEGWYCQQQRVGMMSARDSIARCGRKHLQG
jgi:hypothetical protein